FSTKWKVKFSVISHQLSVLSSALKIGAKCFVFSERFSTFVAPLFLALRVSQSDMTTQVRQGPAYRLVPKPIKRVEGFSTKPRHGRHGYPDAHAVVWEQLGNKTARKP